MSAAATLASLCRAIDAGESLAHFAVATFVRCDTDGIREMTEVWTDMSQAPPAESR